MREITIAQADENQRLDKFLLKYLNKAPKSFVYKMLRKKNIKLNDGKALGNEILVNGDCVRLYLSDETIEGFAAEKTVNEAAGGIDIVFEDAFVLVCNKPAGVLSHPEIAADKDTMIDRILLYLHQKHEFDLSASATFTPALCNRLDRNTSGVVVCGKTLSAVQWLNKAMADKQADKFYKAVVLGNILQAGELKGFHQKDEKNNKATILFENNDMSENAKEVVTRYRSVWCKNGFSYVDITLVTGKSHQIRAHFAQMGHPIVGDVKYGSQKANDLFRRKAGVKSQLLHAQSIVFTQKQGVLGYLAGKAFQAPLPGVFQKALDFLLTEED